MKKFKKIGVSLLGVIILLLVLPIFIPTQSYLKQVEATASEMLNVPVSLRKARIALLPTPRVYIKGIVIGKHADATAADLVIKPTFMSLFADQKVIDVGLEDVALNQSALAIYDYFVNQTSGDDAPSAVLIRNINIEDLHLQIADTALPTSDVMIRLKDHQLHQANIRSVDDAIHLTITPTEKAHHVLLSLKDFTLPTKRPLMINSGQAEMTLLGDQLKISSYDMRLYQGDVTGQANLSWAKQWRLQGDIAVQHLALQQPSRLFSPNTYLSGGLDGNGTFKATAKTAGQLLDVLVFSFKFNVKNGVLHGLDLTKAARVVVKQSDVSGDTQFDQCAGVLTLTGQQYKVSELNLHSGLLAANGYVKVSAKNNLDGLVEVALKKSAGLVAVPLHISGNVDHPMVLPSKAALAGAAVGTAILGPGVGTSLGIKASKGLNKLKEGLFGDGAD